MKTKYFSSRSESQIFGIHTLGGVELYSYQSCTSESTVNKNSKRNGSPVTYSRLIPSLHDEIQNDFVDSIYQYMHRTIQTTVLFP